MSAQHADDFDLAEFVDEQPAGQIDPAKFDAYRRAGVDPDTIVPEGFCQRYGTTSVREALDRAAEAARDGAPRTLRRCPECDSTKVVKKQGTNDLDWQRVEPYKCDECDAHFESPAESREAAMPGEQATLREATLGEVSPNGDD